MNIFQKIYAFLQYRYAVRKADKAHLQDRTRFYVMPNAKGKIRLIVTDRKNFRRLRMKHYVNNAMMMDDVMSRCFYYTPDASGKGAITDTVRTAKFYMYMGWYGKRIARDRAENSRLRRDTLRKILGGFNGKRCR